jgi:hypothetical protein
MGNARNAINVLSSDLVVAPRGPVAARGFLS